MVNQFKFTRVDRFFDDMNREDCFDTEDMDGITPNYKFVLVSDCPSDIEDCIDTDGTLDESVVTIIDTDGEDDGLCSLLYSKGVNGERSISINDSTVSYDLGEESKTIRAIFLVNIANGTGYVLAYSIFDTTIEEDGALILPCNGLVWSIRYGV